MSFFDLFKSHRYDMETLEGINAIPVPAKNYHTGNDLQDCIYYVLQRKATEHKRNGNMDMAIACLRKSNELSDYEKKPLLTQKDYLRLVKYLELAGRNTEAHIEAENIFKRHPEFLDRRISNLPRIKESIKKNKEWKNDCVLVSTNDHCSICKKYNQKVYSISGRTKKYPKLPSEIINAGGFCPNCYVELNTYFEGINSQPHHILSSDNSAYNVTINGVPVDMYTLYCKYPYDKVAAIKELRRITNCSLSEGKKYIDDFYRNIKAK